MNKKTILLLTALSITTPQQTYTTQQSEIIIALGVTIASALGLGYFISYGLKKAVLAAEYEKECAFIAMINEVEQASFSQKFSDIENIIQESKKNNTNPIIALAYYLTTQKQSITALKNQLSDYKRILEEKVKKLSKNIILWQSRENCDQKLIEQAQKAVTNFELSKKLQNISFLHQFIQREEIFLTGSTFLLTIKNKSYNYDDRKFPLIEEMQAKHYDCEALGKLLHDLEISRKLNLNEWDLYTNLIEALTAEQKNLQTSIKNISFSSNYEIEKTKKEKYESEKEYLAIEKARAESERDRQKEQLLIQQRYREQAHHLSSENKKLVRENNTLQEKFEKEQKRAMRLQREIDLLKEKIYSLEQERSLLKSKSEKDIQKIAEIEQKISVLKEKVKEFIRKLKTPPFNPDNENLPKEAQYYIKLIGNFNFEGI